MAEQIPRRNAISGSSNPNLDGTEDHRDFHDVHGSGFTSFPTPFEEYNNLNNEPHHQAADQVSAEGEQKTGEGSDDQFVDPEIVKAYIQGLSADFILKMPLEWVLRHFRHFSPDTRAKLKAYGRYYASLPANDEDFHPASREPTPPARTASNSGGAGHPEVPEFSHDHHHSDPHELFLFQDNQDDATLQREDHDTALDLSNAMMGTEIVGATYRIKYDRR
ncbi:hypothetical protein F5Y06DRAFT_294314 [Hypoxylon sp. FL0890]|nr:hypothetical protein F5Y06DRAFT_294314 [Hypoxylon sp. FL0890]